MERTDTVTWEDPSSIQKAARRMSGLEVLEAIGAGQLPPPPSALRLGMVGSAYTRRTAAVAARVHDRQGVLYAHGTSTCLLLRSKANPTGEVAS